MDDRHSPLKGASRFRGNDGSRVHTIDDVWERNPTNGRYSLSKSTACSGGDDDNHVTMRAAT